MRSTKTSSNPDHGATLRPGLFLDRDGTINTEVDFLRSPDEVQLIPGAAAAIREANRLGTPVIVITNQSGVARGYLTEQDLSALHQRLKSLLAVEGAHIDRIEYCPHHPVVGLPPYNVDCDCRKPKPGMLVRAAEAMGIDLTKSFLVGDRCVDIEAGQAAGCKTILVRTGYGETEQGECKDRLNHGEVARDLKDAWEMIRPKIVASLNPPGPSIHHSKRRT